MTNDLGSGASPHRRKWERSVDQLQNLMLTRLAELGTPGSPMSIRRATERAQGLCSYEILRRIARGEHSGRISDSTAEGIALALEVPVQRVYEAAMVPRPESHWEWSPRYDRLTLAQRRIVEEHAAGYLEAYEKGLRDSLTSASDADLMAEVARRGLRDGRE